MLSSVRFFTEEVIMSRKPPSDGALFWWSIIAVIGFGLLIAGILRFDELGEMLR